MGYLYDRKHDDGRGEIKETDIPLDGGQMHVSQFDRENNRRVSWDTDGNDENSRWGEHPTNQNYPKGHPQRHEW